MTGGTSAQAYKLLKAFDGAQVVLADYGDTPAFAGSNYQMISLGERNDDTIAHHLLNTCLDQQATALLPLHAFEITAVSKAMVLFEEFDIQVLLPSQIELPMYFQNEEDIPVNCNWALFAKGELIFSPAPSVNMADIGVAKALNGVFYIPEEIDGLTAVLYTIP